MNVPDHVYSEIVKLNGVELKSKQSALEKAKTKHKDHTLDEQKPISSKVTSTSTTSPLTTNTTTFSTRKATTAITTSLKEANLSSGP